MTKIFEDARSESLKLLHKNWNGSYPVDLSPVAFELGVSIVFEKLNEDNAILGRIDGGSPIIIIDSRLPIVEKRFWIAHMLGHVVERAKSDYPENYSFRNCRKFSEDSLIEFYADEFAYSILMPFHRAKSILNTSGLSSIEQNLTASEVFKTSPDQASVWFDRILKHSF